MEFRRGKQENDNREMTVGEDEDEENDGDKKDETSGGVGDLCKFPLQFIVGIVVIIAVRIVCSY